MNKVFKEAQSIKSDIINFRREFHKIPEICFDLDETGELIQSFLKEMGIQSDKTLCGGIVALIEGGSGEGPVIGLRADMDGLPVEKEETGLEFSSIHTGKMHSCGHDTHMAMVLGAAKILNKMKNTWNGKVKLIFQPAEEYVSGAKKMIEQGILENPKVDMVLGAHIWQPLKKGFVGIKAGAFMASSDNFKVTIKGKSAHGAMPHEGIDCIAASADFITGIQHLLTRTVPSNENYVLSFGKISGGIKENAIAEKVEIKGTFRTFSIEVKKHIESQIKNYLRSKELTHNITWEYELMNSSMPMINDHDLVLKVKKSIQNIIGKDYVIPFGPVMPAEDFSEYCMRVPSVFFFLGTGDEKYIYPHHHPKFDIDENILHLGSASFTQAIIDLMK